MDWIVIVVGGILTAIVSAIGALLMAWAKFKTSMVDVEKRTAMTTAEIKKDAHSQVVSSFEHLLETAGDQLAGQRSDLIAALDRQRVDCEKTHSEDREFYRQTNEALLIHLRDLTKEYSNLTGAVEKLSEHSIANRTFTQFLHDYLIKVEQERKGRHDQGQLSSSSNPLNTGK